MSWDEKAEQAAARYRDGEARLGRASEEDPRQRQLTRMGNAAWAAGLSHLMAGREDESHAWLDRAVERYRESFGEAPAGSWGRPIAAMKARLLSGDEAGAADAARWALEAGAASAESPIGRYAAALASSILGDWEDARVHADAIRVHKDFPSDVGDALAFVAAEDLIGYIDAVERVLGSFEARSDFLEDVPVADTVLVLQALARTRGFEAELSSDLLP